MSVHKNTRSNRKLYPSFLRVAKATKRAPGLHAVYLLATHLIALGQPLPTIIKDISALNGAGFSALEVAEVVMAAYHQASKKGGAA